MSIKSVIFNSYNSAEPEVRGVFAKKLKDLGVPDDVVARFLDNYYKDYAFNKCSPKSMPKVSPAAGLTVLRKKRAAVKGLVLREAWDVINGERRDMFGEAEDSFDRIANYWNIYMGDRLVRNLGADDVAMMMVLFKIAREQNQHKRDNVCAAAGYLGLYDSIRSGE